ncbi:MAG: isocitrate lyase/phosphoenolpyruvate mutase family protein, partial [Planctomycetota bacterium]
MQRLRPLRPALANGTLALPGAFNGLCARMVADAGFGGCYVSGAAVTASFGVPDVGLVSLPEFCNVIEQVARASGLPVLADADTGFGEAEMVARTVHDYARAGASGFHIEDQVF